MKAIGYQPTVGLGVGQTPARQASGNSLVFGTGSGYDALGKGVGAVLSVYEKEREDDMVAEITAAKNEYDKRISDLLYNENGGLMRRKLDNARGIGREYEEQELKIRQDIMQNMLPKYEKAHLGFTNMVNLISERNFNNVRNYSLQQKDAYRDVNYANAVNFKVDNAQHYYNDPTAVSAQLDEIKKLTWANYVSEYGEEWCSAKFDETEAKVVTSTIETAFANGDTDSVKNLLNTFGDRVSPSVLNRYRKSLLETEKNDYLLTEAERIAKENGYDDAKTDAAIDAIGSYEIDEGGNFYKTSEFVSNTMGTPYKWGGTGEGGYDCSGYTQALAAKMGYDIPRTADAQCHWAEENGKFVPNDGKYQPKAGDLVFITGTDSRFAPSDNWQESQDPDKGLAYRGVTHIGMVNENGDILQAGSSNGVSVVPFSAFDGQILGYGQLSSDVRKVAMSATERAELKQRARTANARHRQDEERRENDIKTSLDNAMFELYEQGVTDPAQYMAIAKRYASEPKIYKSAVLLAENYANHSVRNSSDKLSNDDLAAIKDDIDTGAYVDESTLLNILDRNGVSPKDRRTIREYWKKAQEDAFDWGSQKKDFQQEFGKSEGLWLGAKAAAQDFIKSFMKSTGEKPSYNQIRDALAKAAAKPEIGLLSSSSGFAGYERMGIPNATMRAMGISDAIDNGDDNVTVTYPDGRTEQIDKEDFNKQVDKYK